MKETNINSTNNDYPWIVLFNVPNTLSWIRIIFLFLSIRHFGKRRYLLFVFYHVISGLIDSFDGTLARLLHQQSIVGQFFEYILDQYAHFVMYACIGLLYSSYIVYFYFEIALELWNSLFNLYINTLTKSEQSSLHKMTFFSGKCSIIMHDHPNLRLFNWYGPDIFHTLLVLHYVLINDNERKIITIIKRYISMENVYRIMRYTICFTGFFTILRTCVTTCVMLDKLLKMAGAK